MKLKKIASLALAGVMAVSMLAGCKGNDSSTGDQGTVVVPTVSDIVTALNDGQISGNDAKVEFTANSKLDGYLKAVVAAESESTLKNITTFASKMNAYNGVKTWTSTGNAVAGTNFYGDSCTSSSVVTGLPFTTSVASANAKEHVNPVTLMKVYYVDSSDVASEEGAAKYFAEQVNKDLAALKADDVQVVSGVEMVGGAKGYALNTTDKYYHTYSYTGNASMVSETNADGTVSYYAVMVITQNVTRQEFKA